ncbi:type IV pilus biogenesis protein PilP [Photorhabdus temperata]|uniref:type IV pilus biogenesis protein PilP n=1 Tax=Photorhabdus temperata TaxID=574560 RepID=UPI00038A4422|nr:type IV pilus biogenesis protein PilP [Photorhabdus temperata]EQB98967.1 hypothetical protein B738_21223 [Photorhabdus temperata subsp. temperata M1021]
MVRDNIIRLCSLSLIAFYGIAHADVSTLGDLDKLQSERFYYEAKAAANKAKREADGEIENITDNTGATGSLANPRNLDVMPSLVKINGRKANIALPDGTTRTVTLGEMLPGGRYQVMSVNLNGVIVRRITDGKQFYLN